MGQCNDGQLQGCDDDNGVEVLDTQVDARGANAMDGCDDDNDGELSESNDVLLIGK